LVAHASQYPARAKRVIHLFAKLAGPSQVDTFDPKPELNRLHGKALGNSHLKTERPTGAAFGSPFQFTKHGRCGTEVSELFPNVAKSVDEMVVIRSMQADVPNHEPSLTLDELR
jgi:hypothetical protein